MTTDFNFQKAREAWGDGVVAPTHRVFLEWLNHPLTKALKQSHKTETENLEARIEKLEALLAEAVWNYSELKRKKWVGLTDDEWGYIWEEADTDMSMQYGREDAERMINDKLKEKNYD